MNRSICGALLFVCLALIAGTGFAWPLGQGQYSLWPFNRAWHMYGRNDGNNSQLKLAGRLEGGATIEVPIGRWFRFAAAPASLRFNEISRDPASLRALATYVCRNYNAEAAAGSTLVDVTVTDESWPIELGRRVPAEEASGRSSWIYLDRHPCPRELR